MGVQPTQQVGAGLRDEAQGSLKMALAQRQAAKEAAARASERQQAQDNWQAQMERDQARDAEQRRQFGVSESRLAANQADERKKRYQHAVDPISGEMRLYDITTGEWVEGSAGGRGGTGGGYDPVSDTDTGAVGATGAQGKFTESQRVGAVRSGEGSIAMRGAVNAGFPDEGRLSSLPDTFMGKANRAGFPQLASNRVVQQNTFWSNVADPIVRARTGAAMPVEEFNNQMAMLVPRPGESPEVQMQKAQQLIAFLKSGTVGLPQDAQRRLLAEIDRTAAMIPKNNMDWMEMRSGVRSQTAAPQAGPVQQPASGRNFEAEYGLGGN
jgi:hypothetical protein